MRHPKQLVAFFSHCSVLKAHVFTFLYGVGLLNQL